MKRTAIISAFLFVSLCTAHVEATQIIYQAPEQLGQQSALVVRGKVVGSQSNWNEKHTKIFTVTRVAVEETYKGAPVAVVNVTQLGGTVGTVKVSVAGALQWQEGEEVLLFLEPYSDRTFQVSGFSQGKFMIERDPQTGAMVVAQPALDGVEVLGAAPAETASTASAVQNVSLDRFINRALGRK